MSSSLLFDLPLEDAVRARLSELVMDGCVVSSRTYREVIESRDPCEDPPNCWGCCNACRAEPARIEFERTRLSASRNGSIVWETWI